MGGNHQKLRENDVENSVRTLPYFLLNLLQIIKPFIRQPQGIAISTR